MAALHSFEYLEGLPGTTLHRLYRQPATALAVFRRMLPHLAKTLVMAMLYMGQPLAETDLETWIRSSGRRDRDNALSLLQRLHVLTAEPGKSRAYSLTNPFAPSLRLALTGGGQHGSFGVPCDGQGHVTVASLDQYAQRQWEAVLGYLVGSTGIDLSSAEVELSDSVKSLLELGNLVEIRGRKVEITQAGFAFILQEVNSQVWTLLILYLQNVDMDQVDVLAFLFMLGSLELGLAYSKSSLDHIQLQMLDDLGNFGLILPDEDPDLFYPTRLATTLTSESSDLRSSLGSANSSRGFIVVETNYRIYAYTSSNLQIAILSLFCRLITRYPNMVTGKLTRESIRRAIAMGITSDQIVSYLTTHAHPQMAAKNTHVLPPTVVDQIRLWQLEGDRMKATVGFLFKDFSSQAEYEAPRKYADEIGVLVWQQDRERRFFVTRHEQIAAFLKR